VTQAAPYQKIAKFFRDQILSGELEPGERLPAEAWLADRFGVSRGTATKALGLLRSEGLITTGQGARSVVLARLRIPHTATGANFRARQASGKANDIAEAEARGHNGKNEVLRVGKVAAAPEIAARFGVEVGTPVIERCLINRIDGTPMKIVYGYYLVEFAADTPLMELAPVPKGVSRLIEAEDGPFRRRIARFAEEVEVRMPRPEEAGQLAIPSGVPVARILRTLYDESGEVVEVLDSVLPGDRYVLRYEIIVPAAT
jgi:GntR family transcriptional regulator